MATAASAAPAPRFFDPADIPDVYAATGTGTCLEPLIMDGTCLVFDKNEAVAVGDFVNVWFKLERVKPGQHQAMLKRLAMAMMPGISFPHTPIKGIEPLVVVEMLNPQRTMTIPAGHILAIHKAIGRARLDKGGRVIGVDRFDQGER